MFEMKERQVNQLQVTNFAAIRAATVGCIGCVETTDPATVAVVAAAVEQVVGRRCGCVNAWQDALSVAYGILGEGADVGRAGRAAVRGTGAVGHTGHGTHDRRRRRRRRSAVHCRPARLVIEMIGVARSGGHDDAAQVARRRVVARSGARVLRPAVAACRRLDRRRIEKMSRPALYVSPCQLTTLRCA